ncbi:Leucine dehydrogenase [Candidatus Rubidus massiliensis]|nr:Leucine dehydrogenase [Candidatus Rubidus massiliensis]
MALKIIEHKVENYEKVIEGIDEEIGLHCFIAVHNTTLGPAIGGLRIFPYSSTQKALEDVLFLAKAMTYKSAAILSGSGGGKSVIIADPKRKSPKLLHAFAEVVNSLKGSYVTAADVGTNANDMLIIKEKTPYVCALPIKGGSGDPSIYTAFGVVKGMEAVAKFLWDSPSLENKTILIKGLGNVGSKLAEFLFWKRVNLIVCDIDQEKVELIIDQYGAKEVLESECYKTPCDIFAPCAIGRTINEQVASTLECQAIAGCANNQLATEEAGKILFQKKIVYAPDFIINAGGIINAALEVSKEGYNPIISRDKVISIYDILLNLFMKAKENNVPPEEIAMELAEQHLRK